MSIALSGKKVTVMGLGLHGGALGNIKWLHYQGARITVTDLKNAQELASTVRQLTRYKDVKLVLGEHRLDDFISADIVLRNPAVPRSSHYLQAARKAGARIEMDSSLFFTRCPREQIIGVTGSKGKTTTAQAIAHMLRVRHPQLVAVGIDGVSPLKALPRVVKGEPVVFELSSWRLEALDEYGMSPGVAVVTSLYPDHLNTYASFEEYIETKKTIIRHQNGDDICILNADDSLVRLWKKDVRGRLYWYSMNELTQGEGIGVTNGIVTAWSETQGVRSQVALLPVDAMPLPATHERRNLLPAILLAYRAGMTSEQIVSALSTIQRLPHRLQLVTEIRGVRYINDSAATMPEATIAALEAYREEQLVHILGGSDKKLEFDGLAKVESAARLRALIFLPGTATVRMKATLLDALKTDVRTIDAASMAEAVQTAYTLATPGDVVLLSPGATSFGLFQHEFDRGAQFMSEVKKLEH